jgi:hypothetical protein
VGSGRCGGVPVEGGSSGVAVLRLEVEAKGDYGHGVGAEKKNTLWGGGFGQRRRGSRLKGDDENAVEGGPGESGDAWGGVGEREGALARRKMARAAGIGPRPPGADGVATLQWRAARRKRRGREWLTGGTGRPRGPVGSDGVRGERDSATRR